MIGFCFKRFPLASRYCLKTIQIRKYLPHDPPVKIKSNVTKAYKKDGLSSDNWKIIYRGNDLSVTLFTYSAYGTILALISGTAFIKRNMNMTLAEFLKILNDQMWYDKALFYLTVFAFGLLFMRCRRTLVRVYRNVENKDQYALITYNWLNVPKKQICLKGDIEWVDSPSFLQTNLLGTMQLKDRALIFDERYFETPDDYYLMRNIKY